MRRLQIKELGSLDELKEEGLREEAEGWEDPDAVAGVCTILPDDEGDSPMEGVYFPSKEAGLVSWDGTMSRWIPASSLRELFRKYTQDFIMD